MVQLAALLQPGVPTSGRGDCNHLRDLRAEFCVEQKLVSLIRNFRLLEANSTAEAVAVLGRASPCECQEQVKLSVGNIPSS